MVERLLLNKRLLHQSLLLLLLLLLQSRILHFLFDFPTNNRFNQMIETGNVWDLGLVERGKRGNGKMKKKEKKKRKKQKKKERKKKRTK